MCSSHASSGGESGIIDTFHRPEFHDAAAVGYSGNHHPCCHEMNGRFFYETTRQRGLNCTPRGRPCALQLQPRLQPTSPHHSRTQSSQRLVERDQPHVLDDRLCSEHSVERICVIAEADRAAVRTQITRHAFAGQRAFGMTAPTRPTALFNRRRSMGRLGRASRFSTARESRTTPASCGIRRRSF